MLSTITDNLLLTVNQKNVKLIDFGLAREETVTEMMTAETGTYRWMAPEVPLYLYLIGNHVKLVSVEVYNIKT